MIWKTPSHPLCRSPPGVHGLSLLVPASLPTLTAPVLSTLLSPAPANHLSHLPCVDPNPINPRTYLEGYQLPHNKSTSLPQKDKGQATVDWGVPAQWVKEMRGKVSSGHRLSGFTL